MYHMNKMFSICRRNDKNLLYALLLKGYKQYNDIY